jgi:glycosyltransferase involved in cell wall biosynthesis
LQKFRPDIVHVHFYQAGLSALLFCKLFNMKLVVTEHWTAFIGYPDLPAIRFAKAARVFKYAAYVLPVSRNLLRGIEEKTGVSLSRKSEVINNSVNSSIFHYSREAIAEKNILVVARLDEQKDLPNLFRAIRLLAQRGKEVHVQVIGRGDPAQYKSVLKENKVEHLVQFAGEKEKSCIASAMRSAGVLCLSSISENSPTVIGEALCTGLPVVSTNVGGIPELLDATNGIIVPPRDSEKLAQGLYEALFERKFDREAISRNALTRFSSDAIGEQMFQVYQKVLN